MDAYELLSRCAGFEWDEHNTEKNWRKHRVSPSECEQMFFNRPLVIADDTGHSSDEPRFFALGHTDAERELFIVFTVRRDMIRVISARDMNTKERRAYHGHK